MHKSRTDPLEGSNTSLDDLQQLNEKFIKARRDYESLLETSMAQSAAQQYGRPVSSAPGYPPYGVAPPQNPNYGPQRFYTADGQPPNGAIPTYPSQAPGAQGFQPPYPVSSPPPQSHAPYQQPPPQQQPPSGPQRRQSQPGPFSPQEMHTSVYDTPVTDRNSYSFPANPSQQNVNIAPQYTGGAPPVGQQVTALQSDHTGGGNEGYSPSVYSHHESVADGTQGGFPPPQPGNAPPPAPSGAPPQVPGWGQGQGQGQQQTHTYQAYTPYSAPQTQGQQGQVAGGGDVSGYYR